MFILTLKKKVKLFMKIMKIYEQNQKWNIPGASLTSELPRIVCLIILYDIGFEYIYNAYNVKWESSN